MRQDGRPGKSFENSRSILDFRSSTVLNPGSSCVVTEPSCSRGMNRAGVHL